MSIDQLCADRPTLAAPLRRLIDQYLAVTRSLQPEEAALPAAPRALPQFEGFQTIERLGGGGMGEVYKLKDLKLDRVVAGKIMARRFWGQGYATEAAAAVKVMAARELGWHRLISLILPENERSKAVARRLGGRHERTIPFRGGHGEIFGYDLTSDPTW